VKARESYRNENLGEKYSRYCCFVGF